MFLLRNPVVTRMIILIAVVLFALVVFLIFYKITLLTRKYGDTIQIVKTVLNNTDKIETLYNKTVKSVSHGEKMVIPQITRKIGSFNNEELVDAIRDFTKSIYEGSDISKYLLSEELGKIAPTLSVGKDITVHDVGLAKYSPSGEFIKLIYQVSFETNVQYKVDVEMIFIFNTDFKHMRCTFCGAPLEGDVDTCTYCGTKISTSTFKRWIFSSINNNKKL